MIEQLPIVFQKNERAFRQLARKGIVALYELRNLKANQPHQLIGFELIIIRYQKARHRDAWSYPERERYPFSEEFGRYGWSLPAKTRETAELAFEELASLPFGSVKPCGNKDNYIGWGKGGRPLPKSSTIDNRTKPATERLTAS
jgi:hypothetical protein